MENSWSPRHRCGDWWRIRCPGASEMRSRGFWEKQPWNSAWIYMPRDEEQAVAKYNPRVVSFVMGMRPPESRARSRASGGSRPTSGNRATADRPFSSLSTGSSIEDDLEELRDKLQISHIDDVICHLRFLLEDECRTLEKDIKILQQRLEEERQYLEELQMLQTEPSLTELKEERRVLERDLQLDQLPATSVLTSKIASSRNPTPLRLLDLGRRREDGDSRLSCTTSICPEQLAPPMTPCPPDAKLKSPEGRVARHSFTGPQTPSCAAASPVMGPEEPGESAAHRPIPHERGSRVHSPLCNRGPERKSRGHSPVCDQSPEQAAHITRDRTASLNYGTVLRAPVTPVTKPLVPLPPKVQRPTGSPGPASAFRRVRTLVTNLPP
ncbi:coiled-coil domain-containing protein 24 isoform X2 [Dendropsophus ebraccatus]|uniref:coiled-coil domain-containing protein 24 isoform X2 n=1 Tax=Dendropsophus ebraccatus TaxID=150705 RepID=UPI0038321BB8